MIELLHKLYLQTKSCLKRWKMIILSAAIALVMVLIVILLISGQKSIGSAEAEQEVVKLTQNIRNFYKTRPDYWGLSTQEVISQDIYPLSMKTENGTLIGYFANQVQIGADANGTPVMPTIKSFVIAYNGLNYEQCVALAAGKFDRNFWLTVSSMTVTNDQTTQDFGWSNDEYILPADEHKIKDICSKHGKNNIIFNIEQ